MNLNQITNTLSGQGVLNHGSQNIAAGRDINFYNTVAPHDNEQGRRQAGPEEKHRQSLLASLRFDQMDARYWNIRNANTETCEWILQNRQYLSWSEDNSEHTHGRFLWIKGKPGAGKSTIMKFLLDRAPIEHFGAIISFFFNARAVDEMMRSTFGLYRSLSVQLLDAWPQFHVILDRFRPNHKWCMGSLKDLFARVLREFSNTPVVCFIDALDECPEEEVREMIAHFSELCHTQTKLRVCLSSRHYPNIAVPKGGRSLVLEKMEGHDQDIADYINDVLQIDEENLYEDIKAELQRKASGVFMWVVLTVRILQTAHDAGDMHKLRQQLDELPGDLHELFRGILVRDNYDRPELLLCLQWMLFAERDLGPEELYFAIISGLSPERLAQCHSDEITLKHKQRFVLDKSKGLIEIEGFNRKFQFIHESVRDFLLKDHGLANIWPNAPVNLEGTSQERLAQACLAYIESEPVAIQRISPPSSCDDTSSCGGEKEDVLTAKAERTPFLHYAAGYILQHANKAESHGCSHANFLADFPWEKWVFLYERVSLYRPWKQPWISMPNAFCFLAGLDLGALIKKLPMGPSCMREDDLAYWAPIIIAHTEDHIDAYQALVERHLSEGTSDLSLKGLVFRAPISFKYPPGNCCSIQDILSPPNLKNEDVLSHFIAAGCETLLRVYYAAGRIDFKSLDQSIVPPLCLTALCLTAQYYHRGCYTRVARFLIDQGAQINAPDMTGQTALHIAAANGHIAFAQFLIEQTANINTTDRMGWTPLRWALEFDHFSLAEVLIEAGADVSAATNGGLSPLDYALNRRQYDLVMLIARQTGNPRITWPLD
ncbi:hypothetical protein PG996_000144 [Apiospora saccharicola]|uniref:Nephrocystin 3-like N-terminal domain-containing protein n=1 Tax=Apiospora saccharicola TaxID=335842 RepID=A0ABR1WH07_9PEZI